MMSPSMIPALGQTHIGKKAEVAMEPKQETGPGTPRTQHWGLPKQREEFGGELLCSINIPPDRRMDRYLPVFARGFLGAVGLVAGF